MFSLNFNSYNIFKISFRCCRILLLDFCSIIEFTSSSFSIVNTNDLNFSSSLISDLYVDFFYTNVYLLAFASILVQSINTFSNSISFNSINLLIN